MVGGCVSVDFISAVDAMLWSVGRMCDQALMLMSCG